MLFSGYLSLIFCFWQCYQRHNSKPLCGKKCTCSLRKSSTTASLESCSATEKAPERASTDKSHTFPLRCERDLKRRALHHRERLSVICLQHFAPLYGRGNGTNNVLGHVWFWGNGFIYQFHGRWGKGLLMWMPAYSWKCYIEVFHFLNWGLWIMFVGLFYYTLQYEISLVCFVCFFMSLIWDNIIKRFSAIGFWEVCQYLRWHAAPK